MAPDPADAPGTNRGNGEGEAPGRPIALKDPREEWKRMQENARALKRKIDKDVLARIEKMEAFHYKNVQNADVIKQQIAEDWAFFEQEINRTVQEFKEGNKQRSERLASEMQAKKEDLDKQFKTWEDNYQEWSSKTRKNVKQAMTAWSVAGWKFFFSFLAVAIPIVVIIVVLANALK